MDGTTDISNDNQWDNHDNNTSTIGSDGAWSQAGGDFTSTGAADNSWSYVGSGPTTNFVTSTGTAAAGTTSFTNIDKWNGTSDENESFDASSGYSIAGQWSNGSWTQSGTSGQTLTDTGHQTAVAGGTYTHISTSPSGSVTSGSTAHGTPHSTYSTDWETTGGETQTLGADGGWTTSAGSYNQTGTVADKWDYSGSGTATAASVSSGTYANGTAGSFHNNSTSGGAVNESETYGSTYNYAVNSLWADTSWVTTGTNNSTLSDLGHQSTIGTGSYANLTASSTSGGSDSSNITGTECASASPFQPIQPLARRRRSRVRSSSNFWRYLALVSSRSSDRDPPWTRLSRWPPPRNPADFDRFPWVRPTGW